jgi:hypothetical protein
VLIIRLKQHKKKHKKKDKKTLYVKKTIIFAPLLAEQNETCFYVRAFEN